MDHGNNWIDWHGGSWAGDPDQLVHVMFGDGENDAHLPPVPARYWGVDPLEPSNRRKGYGGFATIIAYHVAA